MDRGCYAVSMERTPTTDQFHHLIGQRAHLIDKMSSAHQRGGDVAGWLPLLSQTQIAIEAVDKITRSRCAGCP